MVRNVKEAHECLKSGEMKQLDDDMNYLMLFLAHLSHSVCDHRAFVCSSGVCQQFALNHIS